MAEKQEITILFRRSDARVTKILRGESRAHIEATPLGKGHFVGRFVKAAKTKRYGKQPLKAIVER